MTGREAMGDWKQWEAWSLWEAVGAQDVMVGWEATRAINITEAFPMSFVFEDSKWTS